MTRTTVVEITCDRCQLVYNEGAASAFHIELAGIVGLLGADMCLPCLANVFTTPAIMAQVTTAAQAANVATADPTGQGRPAPAPKPPVGP